MAESQEFQQWHASDPYLEPRCSLGEGPYYEPATNTLRFVDIIKKQLHTVSLAEGPSSLKTLQFDEAVTVTADIDGRDPQEALLIGAKQGLAVLDRQTGKYEYVTKFGQEKAERIRSNDGTVDPNGRFWLGTMTDFGMGPFQPEGSLYRFAQAGTPPERILSGLMIPNSVGFSPDGRTMYFTHSTAREVLAWDYDPADGSLSNQRVFYRHDGPGEPDGFRVDTDGNLWHAVYGESRVLKITPAGQLVGEVRIPTRNATCCELVGGGELVITTAGDDEGEGESKRLGGSVFKVHVGAEGAPRYAYKLGK
ncbi:ae68128b-f1d3-4f83-afb8-e55294260b0f [Thermothielavioides terrestris]|uniref:SMP-30/Gluconolactonase/LRE-like region domain-containing protein n=2 Tax=Thermothielavioides terrestris TaxID=2587410 RepID=G2RBU7_THETT|nr:uncharacterized protein THITE_71681 [Thermothielavioides terrestris NRRL 8126]AEO69268.1 hypothetical protein THITE_71681 [Thermothielavioides terrestris NRRL 8126]SPQ22454.1 ae68128b-f1d3-4f83-afb8-e55294260b0f [Thermothielavioides terrestris]